MSWDKEKFSSLPLDEQREIVEAVEKILREKKIRKDLSQLSGTENSLLEKQREDGCVTTNINQNGTVTGRVSSSSINVNQIPSSKEFRGLFTAPTMYTIPDNLYYQLKEYL